MADIAIADVETNGLLNKLDRIHTLGILCPSTEAGKEPERMMFRHHNGYHPIVVIEEAVTHEEIDTFVNDDGEITKTPRLVIDKPAVLGKDVWVPPENSIPDGLEVLQDVGTIAGHNWVAFDHKAITKVYPWYKPRGTTYDTLVGVRVARPDTSQSDMGLVKRGLLPGYLVGSHSLDAWGHRLGKHKGDYMKEALKKGLDPWSEWNQDMEDYCVNDVEVNYLLWAALMGEKLSEMSIVLEHEVHSLLDKMEDNGYPFDRAAAERLAARLEAALAGLEGDVKQRYGKWIAPAKKYIVKPQWEKAKPVEGQTFPPPRPQFGEDMSRAVWGDVTTPKMSRKVKGVTRTGETFVTQYNAAELVELDGKQVMQGAYCKMQWKEFNPGSRHHVIDRFTTLHDWVPSDFSEKGNPEVNDAVLRLLVDKIPEAKPIAEIFLHRKILGQLKVGKKSWLNSYNEGSGCIHPYVNSNGAVSGRCTHSNPNIGQVPSVIVEDAKLKNGSPNPKVVEAGEHVHAVALDKDGAPKKFAMLDRPGEYGWECRSLFYVPQTLVGLDDHGVEREFEWMQCGVDLAGIELRMLAEQCAEFDGGELIKVVLDGDPHAYGMQKTGLTVRETYKRGLYGLVYGAGDPKLGSTIAPDTPPHEHRARGAEFRAVMMTGLPALKKSIDKVKGEVERRGYLIGLDGRKLYARSSHSALNLRLQADATSIAKKWLVLTEEYCLDSGLDHGWNGDFAMLAFVHDEIQAGVKKEFAKLYAHCCVEAAKDAGLFFNIKCPVGASPKFGTNWAMCH